ncbi:helix-turn-helix domain-containing protein [Nocardia brasiliensis]
MRSYEVGTVPIDGDVEDGWEVVHPTAEAALDGVLMAGFRDRAGTGLDLRVLPQPTVVVILGVGDHPVTVHDAAESRALPSFVATLSPGPARIHGNHVECVEVRLSPRAAYGLLGVSPRELNGSVTGLGELWGPQERRLREQLADAATWSQRLALTRAFLVQRGATAPPMAPEVATSWDTIVAHRGRIRVDDLAASCGWSRKRLWARFTDQIGLSPKRAAMLVRFDHAARALRAGKTAGEVAATCGYADQPHLNRDLLALAGCTPSALAGRVTSAG